MKGDRVRIGSPGVHGEAEGTIIAVYSPKLDPHKPGYYLSDGHDGVMVEMLGGVKAGTTGVIEGDPVKVQRSLLKGAEQAMGPLGTDLVTLYPVTLDVYQKTGWFPAENIRVLAGGA